MDSPAISFNRQASDAASIVSESAPPTIANLLSNQKELLVVEYRKVSRASVSHAMQLRPHTHTACRVIKCRQYEECDEFRCSSKLVCMLMSLAGVFCKPSLA